MLLAYKVFVEQEWMTIVFAIPFWAAWIFVFVLVVGMFTRRQPGGRRQGLRHIDRAVFALTNRHVPRKSFASLPWAVDESRTPRKANPVSKCRTTGKPLFLFPSMPDGELRRLAHQLSQLIEALSAQDEEEAAAVEDSLGEKPRELAVTDDAVEPPSDTNWRLTHEFDSMGASYSADAGAGPACSACCSCARFGTASSRCSSADCWASRPK